MKKNILKSFSALAVIMMAASCETLDYNENFFGDLGYDANPEITDVQTLEITLTADDYSTIAGLYDNTSMAETAGLSSELSAVGSNGYFSDAISGSDYIPAFLESVYDSYLSIGSKIKVTYDTVAGESAELAAIMAGEAYTVSTEDYVSVWGEEIGAEYFTPSVTAEKNLPTILASALPAAVEGDYALVTYAYSATEPSTGSDEEESEPLVQGFGDFMIDSSTVSITETDGTFVVNGIEFEHTGLSMDSSYGTIYIESTVDGYIKNTTPITGLSEIIVEGNGYVKTNLYLTVGATPDTMTELVSVSDAGSGWGSFYSYIIPEGTQYVCFGIPAGATYDASLSGIEFNVEEDFSIDSSTVSISDTDGTFSVNNASFDYVGLSMDSSYGTIYIESTVDGYIQNTTALPGLSEIIVEGNGYVKTNLYVTVGATLDSMTELVSVSDAGSGWGSFYSYIIPEGTEYIKFGIPAGATYDASLSGIDFIFTDVASPAPAAFSAPAKASVVTSSCNAVYYFDGSAWAAADGTVMLSSADYTAMGSTYGNLSGTQNETLVPIYLANNYPYAVEEDSINVVYKYYSGTTFYKASTYIKGAADWTMVGDIETVVGAPFEKKEAGWMYDPSMTISIGTTDSDNIALYFPTMLSYVKSTYSSEYIDSYGTSEYYSGSASYYGNINWRYSYVLGYWAAAGIDCSPYYTHTNGSDGLVAMYDVLKANLAETFAYALSVHNADADAVDGMEVLYTVKFGLYHGPTISGTNAEMVFEVVGPAKFEFKELNFLDDAADVYSDDNLDYVISTYGTYYQ